MNRCAVAVSGAMWRVCGAAASLLVLVGIVASEGGDRFPEALRMADGTPVLTRADWVERRRPEIVELFRRHVYGRAPVGRPAGLKFEVTKNDEFALGGTAVREDVLISCRGPGGAMSWPIVVFRPKGSVGPVPCFVHIMHRAKPPFATAEVVSPYWPVEQILAQGFATVLYAPSLLDPDEPDGYARGVRAVFDPPGERAVDAWGTIAAWAWGASRVLDYLESNPGIDARRVAVIGHSRSGKAALWAGAEDERFGLVVSNDSGCTGAAVSRGKSGERIADINRQFPHWFCPAYHAYAGREDELPVDQHLLLAAIAPRPVSVASGSNDRWADPASEFKACVLASPVFEFLGQAGIAIQPMPAPGATLHQGRIGYHLRPGGHGLLEYDWARHLAFAALHWGAAAN